MRFDRNTPIAAGGLAVCAAVGAIHWCNHPRKICAVRSFSRHPAWDGKPGEPCPPP